MAEGARDMGRMGYGAAKSALSPYAKPAYNAGKKVYDWQARQNRAMYNKAKPYVKPYYDRAKQSAQPYYNQGKEKASSYYNQGKKKASSYYNRAKNYWRGHK